MKTTHRLALLAFAASLLTGCVSSIQTAASRVTGFNATLVEDRLTGFLGNHSIVARNVVSTADTTSIGDIEVDGGYPPFYTAHIEAQNVVITTATTQPIPASGK